MQNASNIFGAARLGYTVIGSERLAEWRRFAVEAMGMHLAPSGDDELALRLDRHARRLIVQRDSAEDIIAIGMHLDSDDVLQAVTARLYAAGVSTQYVDGAAAAARGVTDFHRFTGPKGMQIELFTTPLIDETPLDMRCSGFVTGAGGLGHLSLMTREPGRTIEFWQEVFDARVSDTIELAAGGREVMQVTFLRLNERHHSIAVAATQGIHIDLFRTRIQHLNVEAKTLDDLGAAYARCRDLGYKLTRTIGQHPNDRELSFYVTTPSGFEMEMGWDALTVEESTWTAGLSYNQMSTWGHDIPGRLSTELGVGHLYRGIRSLGQKEYFPW